MGVDYHRPVRRTDRLSPQEKLGLMFDLIHAFGSINGAKNSAAFLEDLLTANEIKNLSKRLRIAKLLLVGETHRDISHKLQVSLATISKVNLWLSQGGEGFRRVLADLPTRAVKPVESKGVPIEFQGPKILLKIARYAHYKKQTKEIERFTERVEGKKLGDRKLGEAYADMFKKRGLK